MKIKKILLALTLVGSFTFLLAGCNNNAPAPTESIVETTTKVESKYSDITGSYDNGVVIITDTEFKWLSTSGDYRIYKYERQGENLIRLIDGSMYRYFYVGDGVLIRLSDSVFSRDYPKDETNE
jgi:hypothetical protein